jgi:1-deoxy-D-xylulose-5-phosphate reductoisomerase
MQRITLLGATGSIGDSTLDVLRQQKSRFEVFALTANRSVAKMQTLCLEWQPRYAVMADADAAEQLRQALLQQDCETEVLAGIDGLCFVSGADDVDMVMAAIVGAAGLKPALAAVETGKHVLLANKESLVMSGKLFMDAVKQHNATLLPIDSEHNAIFQCLDNQDRAGLERIVLTASGGPFRTWSADKLAAVTVEQACAHPNWSMGRKISVDSASLMNKGLEVIEACWLFDVPQDKVDVVVHPQSVIHSLVAYTDGSMLAQLGNPDMRTPIAYGLAWPNRMASGVEKLDLLKVGQLNFEAADTQRFPCLRLAYEAMSAGGTTTTILNAANEIAVEAFLNQQLDFLGIPDIVERTLANVSSNIANSLETILADDQQARVFATEAIAQRQSAA